MDDLERNWITAHMAATVQDLLAHLEKITGRTIESATLENIEVTTCSDANPRMVRQFVIVLQPPLS